MHALLAIVVTAAAAAACGGRSTAPQSTSGSPPPPPPPPPPDGSAAGQGGAPCPEGQITIESCIVGGMPNEDGSANVSCGRACAATVPQSTRDQDCDRISETRYRCTAYAP